MIKKIFICLTLCAVIGLHPFVTNQAFAHDPPPGTRDSLAHVRDDLAATQGDLAVTQDDLAVTQSDASLLQTEDKSTTGQLLITEARVLEQSSEIQIQGENFDNGSILDIVLGDQTLSVNSFTANEIRALEPIGLTPGTYMLTVTTGASRNEFDAFEITVGAAGEKGLKGDRGPRGFQGDSSGIFLKPDNNGTVSCNVFCLGSQWGPVGACIRGRHTTTDNPIGKVGVTYECDVVKLKPTTCICMTF